MLKVLDKTVKIIAQRHYISHLNEALKAGLYIWQSVEKHELSPFVYETDFVLYRALPSPSAGQADVKDHYAGYPD